MSPMRFKQVDEGYYKTLQCSEHDSKNAFRIYDEVRICMDLIRATKPIQVGKVVKLPRARAVRMPVLVKALCLQFGPGGFLNCGNACVR